MGRVERQTIQLAIESVCDLHMHAGLCVAFTTGKMYGGTSLVCRRWCDYSNKKILVLRHILEVYALQEKNKAVGINLLRQFLLSVRASVLIHEPSRAVLARGTFESIAVTNNCTNTLYYRTAVELLPDGNKECPSRIESARECICLLYTSPSPRDQRGPRMPSSA